VTIRKAIAYLRGESELDPDVVPEEIEVVGIVADEGTEPRGSLGLALERIAAGEADTLFVRRLRAAAGSLGELAWLLEWMAEAGADLIAGDLGLDTAQPEGQRAAALVRELDRWERDREPERRPRGRPGLGAGAPDLAATIGALREQGLSLQAIADELNRRGIPTPRGGRQWRPSSVQSALGYRRPRPPAPSAPPPRPPGHRPRPGGGPPPPRPHRRPPRP
jgi:DNA invertase Pin-like site-specific DNA recombinase